MDRLIIPRSSPRRARALGESNEDQAIGRLVKYIPAEIISGYMLLAGLIDGASQTSSLRMPTAWGLFILGLILTPVYLWRIGRPVGVQWWQLPISTVSFALWVYALGGPFKMTELVPGYPYESWFATFLVGAYSWGISLVWTPTKSD